VQIQGRVMAPGPSRRDSKSLPYWVYYSKSKKRGKGQGKRGGQKAKAYRGEGEEEKVGVYPTSPEQDTHREHCLKGGSWRILEYKI